MNQDAVNHAAALLIEARRTGVLLAGLPEACRPQGVDDAHAIQDATVAGLGDRVAGWKVGSAIEGKIVHGALLGSRIIPSGGSIPASRVPLLGVEAEIAFRLERPLGPRDRPYEYAEVAAAVTAFPAIEIVDSRFRDYRGAPLIERIADCVSNGAFVEGAPRPDWRKIALAELEACLEVDGAVLVRRVGGHPTRDPLLPAVDLVNAFRGADGIPAGRVITTGTFTGLNFVKPGQRVRALFEGFGSVEINIAP
jgi:2-keto-4-pentenoate hydratase